MAYLGPTLRRRKRVERPWRRSAVALAVSLALNWLAAREIKVDWLAGKGAQGPVREVSIAPLSQSQWDANRSAARAPQPLVAVPKPPPPRDEASGQVVITPPSDDRAPESSKYLSERNNRVEKETRSRWARTGLPNVVPTPSAPGGLKQPQVVAPPPRPGERAEARGGKRGAPGQAKPSVPERKAQERLALAFDRAGNLMPRRERAEVRGAPDRPGSEGQGGEEGQGGKAGPGRARIDPSRVHPSAAFFEGLVGAPLDEGLRDVEEGDQTFLNTREWKYAGYLNRVKVAVAATWDPLGVLVVRDPTGQMFAYKDRITLLGVTLDGRGSLVDLVVRKSSGVDFLDQAAMEAFRKAEPFLHPPPGMADADGRIKFSFAFILEGGHTGFRVFRNY